MKKPIYAGTTDDSGRTYAFWAVDFDEQCPGLFEFHRYISGATKKKVERAADAVCSFAREIQ